jgi:glycosyltransferase involved in cell wall biosynthesis
MGGGEKHSLAIAKCLANSHSVVVISHVPVSKEILSERLGLDLSGVEFQVIPEQSLIELSKLTQQYDLFINASHMDYIPPRASRSVMMVYFPTPTERNLAIRVKRWIGLKLKRWLMVPTFDGTFGIEFVHGVPIWRLSQHVQIEIPRSWHQYELYFELASNKPSAQRVALFVDECFYGEVILPANQCFVPCQIKLTGMRPHRLTIKPQPEEGENCSSYQLLLTHFELKHPRYRLYQLLFEQWFKEWGLRLRGIPPRTVLEVVNKYDAIWANSKFTQKWIKKYWGRHSAVLYPPVDIERFKPAQKRNQILNVGRFFAGSHNKKQLEMVQAFRRMVDEGLVGWELHLAGGTAPERIHQEYLQRVKNLAEGYPIVIHTDLPFEQLAQLYAESAIYWHAAGLGEDENREPIKLEHFGITTVEAMAAGCVPVVIGKGGQTEIVQHGHNGFLWHSLKELIEFTWLLIREPVLRQRMANLAVIAASNYDMDHFCQRLKDLLLQLGVDI